VTLAIDSGPIMASSEPITLADKFVLGTGRTKQRHAVVKFRIETLLSSQRSAKI
jgi:hypothetical protein